MLPHLPLRSLLRRYNRVSWAGNSRSSLASGDIVNLASGTYTAGETHAGDTVYWISNNFEHSAFQPVTARPTC